MISRIPIAFHDDLIINRIIIKDNFTMYEILELSLSSWYVHAYDVVFSASDSFFHFVFAYSVTESVVLCFLVFYSSLLQAHLLEAFCCAEAVVGVAVFYEGVDVLFVDVQAFGLNVWWVWAMGSLVLLMKYRPRSFIIFQTSPIKIGNNFILRSFNFSLFVRILNPEYKLPTIIFSEQIIIQRRPQPTNM